MVLLEEKEGQEGLGTASVSLMRIVIDFWHSLTFRPPREMSYNTATGPRQRAVSNTMLAGGMGDNRASSYSTCKPLNVCTQRNLISSALPQTFVDIQLPLQTAVILCQLSRCYALLPITRSGFTSSAWRKSVWHIVNRVFSSYFWAQHPSRQTRSRANRYFSATRQFRLLRWSPGPPKQVVSGSITPRSPSWSFASTILLLWP